MTTPMTAVAIVGAIRSWVRPNEICFLTKYTTPTTERAIMAEAIATPLNPNQKIAKGVKIHVESVQKIIRYNVVLTFPIAFNAFVSGVEIAEIPALTAKKVSESKAGSHF